MVIPSGGCHRRIRRELLLCVISGELLNHPGLTGFPTPPTLHPPEETPLKKPPSRNPSEPSTGHAKCHSEFKNHPGVGELFAVGIPDLVHAVAHSLRMNEQLRGHGVTPALMQQP